MKIPVHILAGEEAEEFNKKYAIGRQYIAFWDRASAWKTDGIFQRPLFKVIKTK